MPALPAVPKVVRLDYVQQYGNDLNVINRIFAQYSGTLSLADANTWAATAVSHWTGSGNWVTQVNSDLTLLHVELTDLSSSTAPQVKATSGTSGSLSGQGLPAGVAMVVQFKILRRYR